MVYKKRSLKSRFDTKWVVDPVTSCWMWTAGIRGDGYGSIRMNGKNTSAHRVSWVLHRGEIPTELNVLHNCDTRACVNPEHLRLGTDAENASDRSARSRVSTMGRPRESMFTINDLAAIAKRLLTRPLRGRSWHKGNKKGRRLSPLDSQYV